MHRKLARGLSACVKRGVLGPGSRLPSERALADALSISRTTVIAAYTALREEGWLESRMGSGTRIRAGSQVTAARDSAITESLATNPIVSLLHAKATASAIDFALGSPYPLEELPMERFALAPSEHAALLDDRAYCPLGLPQARQRVADYFSQSGLPTSSDQILMTSGAQHALSLCASLCVQRGDSVLAEDPAYFGALDAFRVAGARVFPLPVETNGISVATLRARISATAARLVYLSPTFQNPTGSVMPTPARKEVARIALELGTPVIEDGTLSDIALENRTTPPYLAAYSETAPILTIGSMSKLAAPGLRVGWIRAHESTISRLAQIRTANDLGAPLLTQAVFARMMGAFTEIKQARCHQLRARRDLLAQLLSKQLPNWRFRIPTGGLFLWVELPAGDAREFAQAALRHGVMIVPGPTMSTSERHTRNIRLPFLADEGTLREGIRRLSAAWREYRPELRSQSQVSVAIV